MCGPDDHRICPLPSLCLWHKTHSSLSFPVLSSSYSRLQVKVELGQGRPVLSFVQGGKSCFLESLAFSLSRFLLHLLGAQSAPPALRLPQISHGHCNLPKTCFLITGLKFQGFMFASTLKILPFFTCVVRKTISLHCITVIVRKGCFFLPVVLLRPALLGLFGFFPPPFSHSAFWVLKTCKDWHFSFS